MDIVVIAKCMLKLFIILILGFVLNKCNIIDNATGKKLSSLVVKVTAPLWIISTALSASTQNRFKVLLVFGAGILMYLGFIVLARIVTTLLRINPKDRPVYECMMVFSNNSFMGFPVLQSVLGDEAVFYSSMLHFSFNIFIYTYAVYCLKSASLKSENNIMDKRCNTDRKEGSAGNRSLREKASELAKSLITPGFILILLALVIFITGIRDDGVIYETCYMIGNTTSVLSMLVLGAAFAQYPVKESLSDLRSYGFSVIRLLIIPFVTLGVCRILHINEFYTAIATITNGMPVASMVVMMANEHDADTKIVTRNIVVTTALSLITIPIIVALL